MKKKIFIIKKIGTFHYLFYNQYFFYLIILNDWYF